MPETVTFNAELGIIECRSFGDVSLADVDKSLSETKQIQEESGVNKVLVDVSEHTLMPKMSGTFQIATSIPRSLRVAILLLEGQPTEEALRFVETAANRGEATVQCFTSRDDAIAWLNR